MVARAITAAPACIEATPQQAAPAAGSSLAALRALLGVRNAVRLSAGNGLAQAGIRLQSIVLAWLVLETTGSKLMLSLVIGLPAFAVVGGSLLAALLADSSRARPALWWTRVAMAAVTAFAGVLVTAGHVEAGLLMVVALITSFSTAVDMPIGRTLVVDLVGRERALPGMAMNSAANNLVTVAGPLAVGLLMSRFGVDVALYAVAASYVASAALLPKFGTTAAAAERSHPLQDLQAGFDYLRRTPCVAWLVALCFLVPLAGIFFGMVPVYAHEVLDVGPAGLGALTASYGAGTVVGSAFLVVRGRMQRRGLRVTLAGVAFGVTVLAFGLSGWVWLSCLLSFVIGVNAMLWFNMVSALVQTAAAPEMRGRAMSIATMGLQMINVGWLFGGVISTLAGPEATVLFAGTAFAALSAFVFARSRDVRVID